MSDQSNQPKPMSNIIPQRLHKDTSATNSQLSRGQIRRIMMATAVGGSMLGLAGMTLTGTLIVLIIATPLLVLLSPILVLAAAVLSLITSGFLFSGSCLIGTLAVAAMTYWYVTGKPPLWARVKINNARKARDVKEISMALKDYGQEEAPAVQG